MESTFQNKDAEQNGSTNPRGSKRTAQDQSVYESLKRKALPRNAQAISLILKSFGINDVQPNVIYQLQEFAHRYASDVLQDALILSEHCSKASVDSEDVREAIAGRIHHSFAPPPCQEFIKEMATKINNKPLPIIHEKFGVRLPKDKYCLTATNFQILPEGSTIKEVEDKVNGNKPEKNESVITQEVNLETPIKQENDDNQNANSGAELEPEEIEQDVQVKQEPNPNQEEEEEDLFEEVE